MKKMTKRTLALAMSTGMLLSNSVWAADTDADPYGAMPETVTLHVGRSEDANASYLSGQDSLNNYLVDYIKEQLNVDFVYDFSVASDYSTKVSMAIASGSIPDIMFVTASQLRELVAADAVEDMTAVYETYASDNLKAAYDTTDGISFENATFDGKLMAMPSISPGADAIPILFVRGDWMDELGLDEPKTVEDITNIVKAFKEKYGDSNSLVMSQNIVSENGNNSNKLFKKTIQTICFLPHFLSWVVLAMIFRDLLDGSGIINSGLMALGIIKEPIVFLGNNSWFQGLMIGTDVWKEFGYGAIIFIAALTSINTELYEAAAIDGAGRLQRIWHITLPGIAVTIVLVATLNIANILNAGFDQIYNLYSPIVYSTGDIIDTYVYRMSFENAQYSLATAIGLLKSLVSFILIVVSNFCAGKFANYRIF